MVDYSEPGWTEQARQVTGGKGPDVVLDGAGGHIGWAAFEVTAPGGRFSAHGAPSNEFAKIDPDEVRGHRVTVFGSSRCSLRAPTPTG